MIKIEAPTLQEAYSKAARELSCSVVDLEINIVQNGSNGFLGLFKKSAIIEAYRKGEKPKPKEEREPKMVRTQEPQQPQPTPALAPSQEKAIAPEERHKRSRHKRSRSKSKEPLPEGSTPKPERVERRNVPKEERKESDIPKKVDTPKPVTPRAPRPATTPAPSDLHYQGPKKEVNDVLGTITEDLTRLFKQSCFQLETPVVSKFDNETVLIEFSGEDAALLIGKEGYRYKALSYLLYNWINLKYGLNIRLEIAEFLKNQEEMIEKYLQPVIERIRASGKGQTKILDGVLIKIALESLRHAFPDKYVGIKSGREGGKFIVVNDFNRKNA